MFRLQKLVDFASNLWRKWCFKVEACRDCIFWEQGGRWVLVFSLSRRGKKLTEGDQKSLK